MNLLIFNLKTDADDDVLGFTTDWVNGIAAHCKKVFVITMSSGRIAVENNVQVFSVGKELGYSELRRAAEFYRLLSWLLLTERIDACFAHMMPLFALMAWPLLRLRGIPIVLWYAHSHVSSTLRLVTCLVDRVVASSVSGFKIPTEKLRIIGQGINVERFQPTPHASLEKDLFVLLTVGRISPVKRLELLIRALPLLPERLPDGRSLIVRFVGNPLTHRDRIYLDSLRQLAVDLSVAERIEFHPALSFVEVDRAYQTGNIFVNSSDTDSVDKTVLEAMSCGLPVATSNAAFAEIFDPCHIDLCYLPKGNEEILANRLREIIDMPEINRLKIGEQLRETVIRDHSLNSLCERLVSQIYELKHEINK